MRLTNAMKQSASSEADSSFASEEIILLPNPKIHYRVHRPLNQGT